MKTNYKFQAGQKVVTKDGEIGTVKGYIGGPHLLCTVELDNDPPDETMVITSICREASLRPLLKEMLKTMLKDK
jgi:hypothetical protein